MSSLKEIEIPMVKTSLKYLVCACASVSMCVFLSELRYFWEQVLGHLMDIVR